MPWYSYILGFITLIGVGALLVAAALAAAAHIRSARNRRDPDYHSHRVSPGPVPRAAPLGHGAGSMVLDEERAYWLRNGHTWGCLRPAEDHLGACPEEGDWADDRSWPVPYLPVDHRPDVMDTVLALEEEDPAGAGWTDQLLAGLHDAPTVLDENNVCWDCGQPTEGKCVWCTRWICLLCSSKHNCPALHPDSERLADTGEIRLASLRADFAAQLRAQDDDAIEFISRQATDVAEYRLIVNGLA